MRLVCAGPWEDGQIAERLDPVPADFVDVRATARNSQLERRLSKGRHIADDDPVQGAMPGFASHARGHSTRIAAVDRYFCVSKRPQPTLNRLRLRARQKARLPRDLLCMISAKRRGRTRPRTSRLSRPIRQQVC
jgi:hypothetical protein